MSREDMATPILWIDARAFERQVAGGIIAMTCKLVMSNSNCRLE